MNRKLTLLTLVALLLSLQAGAASWLQQQTVEAREADDLYRQERFADAIVGYENVLAKGAESAELHYNLANAYFREELYARAILHYERALRLRPGMDEARQNLALAQSRTTDRITQLPVLFVVRWWDGLTTRVLPSVWRVVTLLLLALLAAGGVLLLVGRSVAWRKRGLVVAVVAIPLLAFSVALQVSSTSRFNAHRFAIVVEPAMSLKHSPEDESADRMVLHEGTKVKIAEQLPGWDKIVLADGTDGWCRAEYVERI